MATYMNESLRIAVAPIDAPRIGSVISVEVADASGTPLILFHFRDKVFADSFAASIAEASQAGLVAVTVPTAVAVSDK